MSFVILDLPLYHRASTPSRRTPKNEEPCVLFAIEKSTRGPSLSYEPTFHLQKDGKLDDVIAGIEELHGQRESIPPRMDTSDRYSALTRSGALLRTPNSGWISKMILVRSMMPVKLPPGRARLDDPDRLHNGLRSGSE